MVEETEDRRGGREGEREVTPRDVEVENAMGEEEGGGEEGGSGRTRHNSR